MTTVDRASTAVDRLAQGLLVSPFAVAVPVVESEVLIAEVDRLFRGDHRLRAVVVRLDDGWGLLSRDQLEAQLSGPFGYGRSLHSRSTAGEMVSRNALTLPPDLSLAEAASRVLNRDPDNRYQDVLVAGAGHPVVITVAAIFEQLSNLFRHAALHDPLTGLPNRRLLDEYGSRLIADGHDPARIAILYVDLDGFKLVNDSFGHRAGDELLVTFADRLRACVRPNDIVARLGGDEFAALLLDVSEVQAMAVAERVVLNASAPFVHAGEPVYISASVGVAMADDIGQERDFTQLDALLRLADSAMLHAKRTGKRRVERLAGDNQGDTVMRRGLIRRRLQAALNHDDGLSLHYQPKLDLLTGGTSSVEALLRWTDTELGAVSPAEFIPIAEDSDQVSQIGRWVLNRACAQARRWLDDGHPRTVSVNVSPVELRNPNLVQSIHDALTAWALPPHLLRVEITETAAVLDLAATVLQLRALRRMGIEIELDDFGTGYSSLSMLRDLPLTAVKIDKSFIDDIDSNPAAAALLKGVIEAAHALDLTVTAEGVERAAQLSILRALGCDTAQGFLIARPTAAR